jgi:hypothetical protein
MELQRLAKLFLMIVCLVFSVPAVGAENGPDEPFVTGKEWLEEMSPREKFMSLIPPALLFSEYEVDLRLSLPQYIYLVDRALERNPEFEHEDITNIFASTVYVFEPQNRLALKRMETSFLRGELDPIPVSVPRLTVDKLLKEVSV